MAWGAPLSAQTARQPSHPSYTYEIARGHEIKPHRRTIPLKGVEPGFNQLRLTILVSAQGDVVNAEAGGDEKSLALWPTIKDEVLGWKFVPFEEKAKPVAAEVEEYLELVPPEQLPKTHFAPPPIRPDSKVEITLERTGCYGSCPAYEVTVSTSGIDFRGKGNVVASGHHHDWVNADDVRNLAKRFVAADFYSMAASYRASVTDNPTYALSITVDGNKKEVEDYVGEWEGMPAIISELENEVDTFARTERWIQGGEGLVSALRAEHFSFESIKAQELLKEALTRGESHTVRELLDAGVPLEPIAAPKLAQPDMVPRFDEVGWLTAASRDPESLRMLIEAQASKNDQKDKDLALADATRAGNLQAVRELIRYGANPLADLSKLTVTETGGGMTLGMQGAGSILIYAAESGNPDMVREILAFQPKLEMKDREGRTAIFAAGESRYEVKEEARAECVRLLAKAGANVNARDNEGNTPLHESYLTEVEKVLLELGADVNARNDDGETPIFTNVDDDSVALFIEHGADLNIRNKKNQSVVEAAKEKGPARQKALQQAIDKLAQH